MNRRPVAFGREGTLEAPEIAGHQGLHIGVGDGGRGALVLARLWTDLRRQRDADVRTLPREDVADVQLVRGVGVGMDERHRDGFDPLLVQPLGDRPDGCLVEGETHLAVHVHALRHGEAKAAADHRPGLLDEDVVLVEPALVGDLDDVAEALGGDQGDPGALALDDRVRRQRGAVHEHLDVGECAACLGKHAARAFDDGSLGRPRCREDLERMAALRRLEHDVGERAADVGGESDGGNRLLHRW